MPTGKTGRAKHRQADMQVANRQIRIQADRQTSRWSGRSRQAHKQTDRQAEWQKQVDTQTDKQADAVAEAGRHTNRQTDRQAARVAEAGRHTNRQTDRQAGGRHREAGRHAGTQTLESDRQTDRQAGGVAESRRQAGTHAGKQTVRIAFGHLPPNSAIFGYATQGALFISAHLTAYAVSALRINVFGRPTNKTVKAK